MRIKCFKRRPALVASYWRERKRIINFGENIPEILLSIFGYKLLTLTQAMNGTIFERAVRMAQPRKMFYPGACMIIVATWLNGTHIPILLSKCGEVQVWGCGAGGGPELNMHDPDIRARVKFYAVRGPLTRERLGLDETVALGDPGFLLPIFYPSHHGGDKNGSVIFMPHHQNRTDIRKKLTILGADRYVDIMGPRRAFWHKLREILTARFVLTNSLHTAIVAHAYGVPWALSLLDGEALHAPFKWRDVLAYLGIPVEENGPGYNNEIGLNVVADFEAGLKWFDAFGKQGKVRDLTPLLEAFPHPIVSGAAMDRIERYKISRQTQRYPLWD